MFWTHTRGFFPPRARHKHAIRIFFFFALRTIYFFSPAAGIFKHWRISFEMFSFYSLFLLETLVLSRKKTPAMTNYCTNLPSREAQQICAKGNNKKKPITVLFDLARMLPLCYLSLYIFFFRHL